jgi:hypothetical protein
MSFIRVAEGIFGQRKLGPSGQLKGYKVQGLRCRERKNIKDSVYPEP